MMAACQLTVQAKNPLISLSYFSLCATACEGSVRNAESFFSVEILYNVESKSNALAFMLSRTNECP